MNKVISNVQFEDTSFNSFFDMYNERTCRLIKKQYESKRKKYLFHRRLRIVLSGLSILSLVVVCSLGIGTAIGESKDDLDFVPVVANSANMTPAADSMIANAISTQKEVKSSTSADLQYSYQSKYPELYCTTSQAKSNNDKVVYLTFDDGPSDLTITNLNILKAADVKATFFVVGAYAEKRKDILQRMVDEGHTIGIHTYSHVYRDIYSSVDSYLDDFAKTYDVIYEATGVAPSIFRFPGGSNTDFNEDIRDELITELNRRGFTYYDWNISSGDATSKNFTPNEIENNVLSTLNSNGESIVLMHDLDSKKSTSLALESMIENIKQQGYRLDKLDNTVEPIQFYYLDSQ